MLTKRFFGFLALFLLIVTSLGAQAQENYPNRPIRFVLGFPAGGGTDSILRSLAAKLAENLAVSVIVENKPGANANIAGEFVSNAAADGYTFLFSGQAFLTNAALHSKLPYDIKKDFAPLTQVVVSDGYVLVVNSSLRINNPAELIEQSKIPQKPIRYGSP